MGPRKARHPLTARELGFEENIDALDKSALQGRVFIKSEPEGCEHTFGNLVGRNATKASIFALRVDNTLTRNENATP